MIADSVALWTGRVMLLLWTGMLAGALAALACIYGARLLRRLLSRRVQTRAKLVRAPAILGPDISIARGPDGVWRERDPFAQRDLGDETDVVPEGLGYPAVRDGHLLTLGALHPNDQAIFGPARRP